MESNDKEPGRRNEAFAERDYSLQLVKRLKAAKSIDELLVSFNDVITEAGEKGESEPLYIHPERGIQPVIDLYEHAHVYLEAIKLRGDGLLEEEAESVIANYQNYGFPPEFIERARVLASH